MRPTPRDPVDDLDELRRLLISPEQAELRGLHERLDDKEQRAREVAGVLPEAVKLSRERSEELSRALQPAVEGFIRESIENRPQVFIDALHPIIGSVVRRSIAESLRGLLQTLNQTLEHTFSWQGLKWRFEALRTGRSFAEVVMLRSLVYRVEQIFLIHRETSMALLHVSADASAAQDSDMVAGMLSAIQDFARDSFHAGKDESLDEFRIGDLQVWIAPGRYAYLAAVVRGNPPRELRNCLEDAIESVHVLKGSSLAKFDGDAAVFESLRADIEPCLRAQYQTEHAGGSHARAHLVLVVIAAIVTAALLLAYRSERHWDRFVARLNSEPGIAVTHAHKGWLSRSEIAGLRDPVAKDAAAIAREAHLNPAGIRFAWKDYLALDAALVQRRFEARFGKPAGTEIALTNGVVSVAGNVPYEWLARVRQEGTQSVGVTSVVEKNVTVTYDPAFVLDRFCNAFPPPPDVIAKVENQSLILSGTAPYEWIAPVREGAKKLPGIRAISEQNLQIAFDPKRVLQRFSDRFGLPDTVNAMLDNGVLALSGEVAHGWLARVRHDAATTPGIRAIDERNLVDLDQRTFQQSKSVIESAFVYFLINKDNFATEGFAALSRLPDEVRRCLTAAKRLGLGLHLEVRGYADAVGTEAKNADLSRRRAEAVRDFLVTCGFDSALFKPMGLGAPPVTDKPTAEQSDRRVAFRVVSDQPAATP